VQGNVEGRTNIEIGKDGKLIGDASSVW